MFLKLKAGSTSRAIPLRIKNSSTGLGLSGLVYNTADLAAAYRREGQNSWTVITLATMTLGTWTSGGFVASGSRDGDYELGLPNAALASGAKWVEIKVYGAASMLDCDVLIELDAIDYQTAIPSQVDTALIDYAGGNGVARQDTVLTISGLAGDIKAKTDNLPSDPADQSDIMNALTVIDDLLDTEIGSIITSLSTLSSDVASSFAALNDLDATAVQTAAAAALNAYDPPTKAELDAAQTAITAAIAALNNLNAAGVWDLADGIETGETPRQELRLIRAILLGLLARTAGTSEAGTVTFKRKDSSKTAATVTYDGGERTSVMVGDLT